MKALLLAAALVALLAIFSDGAPLDAPATHPTGVADIPWGSSPAEVRKAMLARAGVSVVLEGTEKLVLRGGSLGEEPVEQWELFFAGGKFSEAYVRLKPLDVLRQYEGIRKLITAKYRKAGREEREGSEHRATYWEYAQTTGKWGIACDVRIPGSLTIRYKDKSRAATPAKGAEKDF